MAVIAPIRTHRLVISTLLLVSFFASIWFRGDIKAIFRMLGFSAYLAATGQRWPDARLVRDANRACDGCDDLVPYWGTLRRDDGDPPPPPAPRKPARTAA